MSIPNETIASLEAVLFACGGPVEAERLRELLALSPEELEGRQSSWRRPWRIPPEASL